MIEENESRPALPESGADSLIIVSHNAAASMVNALWSYLKGSGAFAVYCPTIEVCEGLNVIFMLILSQPLAQIHNDLQRSQRAINLGLTESWLREYQVFVNELSCTDFVGATTAHSPEYANDKQ